MLNITAPTGHADVAHTQGFTGTGIGVAVIDRGVSDKPEFHNGASRIVYQQSFVQNSAKLNLSCPGGGLVGAWYADSLTAQGGIAPYTFSITAGSLPAGLSLDAAGNITGIPSTPTATVAPAGPAGPAGPLGPGAQTFSATVTDAYGTSVIQGCNLNVGAAPPAGPKVAPLHLGCPAGGAQATAWYDSPVAPQATRHLTDFLSPSAACRRD
jgi:hypothetical protein